MIFDSLDNAKQYCALNNKLKKGFDFLLNSDLKNLKEGKYEIEGQEIFANIQTLTTKEKSEQKWEVHRKYIDIQYLIHGHECMGYGILKDFQTKVTEYDKEKDIEFLEGEVYNYINLKEGDFVIFFPNDVHAPMLYDKQPKNIKKVIVKIAID